VRCETALEDGTIFHGESFGAQGEVIGEIVFLLRTDCCNDLSFDRQLRCKSEDIESENQNPSNWRAEETLNNYLKRNNIIGIEKIDTRALTRILREKGTMKGMISTDK